MKGSNKKRILPVSVCVCQYIGEKETSDVLFNRLTFNMPKIDFFSSKLHSELKKVAFLSLSAFAFFGACMQKRGCFGVCVCVQCVRSTLLLSTKNTLSAATLARGGSCRLFSTLPLFANGALQP